MCMEMSCVHDSSEQLQQSQNNSEKINPCWVEWLAPAVQHFAFGHGSRKRALVMGTSNMWLLKKVQPQSITLVNIQRNDFQSLPTDKASKWCGLLFPAQPCSGLFGELYRKAGPLCHTVPMACKVNKGVVANEFQGFQNTLTWCWTNYDQLLAVGTFNLITKAESASACVCVCACVWLLSDPAATKLADWPVNVNKAAWWGRSCGTQIRHNGGRGRGWGALAGGSKQAVMSSGKTPWETLPWRGQLLTQHG